MPRSSIRRLSAAAVATALAMAGASATMAVAPPTVGPNVDITRLANNEAETNIAINPTNPDNVVMASNLQVGDGLVISRSVDGGAHWTVDVVGDRDNLGNACCDPSLAFDSYGNLFLTYLDVVAKRVQAAWSTDGAATWRFLTTIEQTDNGVVKPPPTKGAGGGVGVDQPTVATGPGSVWVTWKHYAKNQRLRVRGASVLGLGQIGAWGPSQAVPGSRDGTFGDIVVGPRGQVMVTYQDHIPTQGPSDIFVNLDPDGLGPAPMGPATLVTSTNVGGFDLIPPQASRSVDAEAGLAWDRTGGAHAGRVYLVYTDETVNEDDDTNIFVRWSDDGGAHWSARVRVNDDAGANSQFNPHVEIDQTTGVLGIGWHDARNDLGDEGAGDTNGIANDDTQYFVTVSRDGAASFEANDRVSTGTSNGEASQNGVEYGDYTGLAFYGGVLRPAWADNSNSTGGNPDGALSRFDVYSAAVTIP